MAPAGHSHRHSAGFALVEALASLVVVGMIALMMSQGVMTGRRAWERIDSREASGEVTDSIQSLLRNRIEQTFPSMLYNQAPPYIDFVGGPESMVFLANPPRSERPSPLRRYTLTLDRSSNLLLNSISDVAQPAFAPVTRQVLLTGVRRIDVAYFGAARPDMIRRWRSNWQGESTLPELVRIRLSFGQGDARAWPDLLIHPQANVDAACLATIATSRCKGRT